MSLFIDAIIQIDAAAESGAPFIERSHRPLCPMPPRDAGAQRRVQAHRRRRLYAAGKGLKVNAGHGLHLPQRQAIAAFLSFMSSTSATPSLGRAAFDGLAKAVGMRLPMQEARQGI